MASGARPKLAPLHPPEVKIIITSISFCSKPTCNMIRNLLGCILMTQWIIFTALTSNSDVRLLALLCSGGAPGHALAPVLVEAEDLLHLLSGDVNCHLHDWQRCEANTGIIVRMVNAGLSWACTRLTAFAEWNDHKYIFFFPRKENKWVEMNPWLHSVPWTKLAK